MLLLPWLFLSVVVALLATFWWPGFTQGHLLQVCISPVLAVFFLSFAAAAVTFSRDVVAGRYP